MRKGEVHVATAKRTRFKIMRFEPVEQVTVNAVALDGHLVSWALLAIGKAGGRLHRITATSSSQTQSLAAVFPTGGGAGAARRIRAKVHRHDGAQVVLERDRAELQVRVDEAPIHAARCIWALEDAGVLPSACWIDAGSFGLVVAREHSAEAAATCYRILAASSSAATDPP